MSDRKPAELPRLPEHVRGPARKFYEYAQAELERRRTSGEELDEGRYARAVRMVLRRLGVTPESPS